MSTQGMFYLITVKYSFVNLLSKIYKDVTLFFSQDQVSLIANVIPTMDCEACA